MDRGLDKYVAKLAISLGLMNRCNKMCGLVCCTIAVFICSNSRFCASAIYSTVAATPSE